MTVAHLKELLKNFDDNDRIIIDNGNYEATPANEIIYMYKILKGNGKETLPVVICQTRADFDVENELEAAFVHFQEENWEEADALDFLFNLGYTLNDMKYDLDRYEWAKRVAEEHGLV